MFKPRKKPNNTDPLNRCPPHSEEAERGILGCCLIDPAKCLNACIERIKTSTDLFYDLRYQTIYHAMLETLESRKGLDEISLYETLKRKGEDERVGGLAFISTLPDCTPSIHNLPYYLDIAFEKYVLRKLLQLSIETKERIYDFPGKANDLLDSFEKDALAIRPRGNDNQKGIKHLVGEAINEIERYHQNSGGLLGLSTGLVDLDTLTCGLMPGEMSVLAGYPSSGKTTLAMNIIEHLAIDCGVPCGVFSLEMTAKQLVIRCMCSRSRVNVKNIKHGWLAERDFPKLTTSAAKISKSPIYIDDESEQSIQQIRAKTRRMVKEFGIKVAVLDYLQLAKGDSDAENKEQEIDSIAKGCKNAAKELQIHFIALSQLNNDGKLRGSGAISQHTDNAMFLDDPESTDDCVPVELHMRKQRNGAKGKVNLLFIKSITRFESVAKIQDDTGNGN